MSIDARVTDVRYGRNGTAKLYLEPADPGRAPAGQSILTVLNPVPGMESMIGVQIWGSSERIMVGQTDWARRVSYTKIRLNPPKGRN